MSAKWRRRKDPKRFKIFESLRKAEKSKSPKTFQIKKTKGKSYTYTHKISETYQAKKGKEPAPLIDIFEEKDEVVVVAELAGFNSETLITDVKNQRLTLSAETVDRKYHKSLNLPKGVIPNSIRTSYKNGVLEIRLKKTVEERTLDKIVG